MTPTTTTTARTTMSQNAMHAAAKEWLRNEIAEMRNRIEKSADQNARSWVGLPATGDFVMTVEEVDEFNRIVRQEATRAFRTLVSTADSYTPWGVALHLANSFSLVEPELLGTYFAAGVRLDETRAAHERIQTFTGTPTEREALAERAYHDAHAGLQSVASALYRAMVNATS